MSPFITLTEPGGRLLLIRSDVISSLQGEEKGTELFLTDGRRLHVVESNGLILDLIERAEARS